MVSGKNAVSGGVDLLSIGSKAASKTSKAKKSGEGDFKTMLDQNAQSTQNTQGTQNTQNTQDAEKPKADAAEAETRPAENAVPKQEETMEENGMELEVLAQFVVMPEQERAALNWAEEMPEDGAAKAVVETVGEDAAGAAEAGVQQAETQATSAKAETGLPAQAMKATDENGQAAQAAGTQDAGAGMEAAKEVKVQGAAEAGQDGAGEQAGVKAGTEEAQGTATEETKTAEDTGAQAAAPKFAQEDDLLNFKVGDAVKLSSPQAAENMAETILVRAGENNREFEMQLNPEELGSVKIKMVFQEGKIHIAMTCDNQKAMDLLSSTSSKLKELIEERTGSEVTVQVEQENETPYHEQEKQDGRDDAQQNASHKQDNKNGTEPMDFIQQLRLGLVGTEQ